MSLIGEKTEKRNVAPGKLVHTILDNCATH